MRDQDLELGVLLSSLFWFIVCNISLSINNDLWEIDAVEAGVGRYNPTTSHFEWIQPDEETTAESEENGR